MKRPWRSTETEGRAATGARFDRSGARLVVLANRAPLRHERGADGIVRVTRATGGLVAALEPLIEAHGGTWVAHAAGNADLDPAGDRGGAMPPASSRYRLRYVRLPEGEHQGYYYGLANEGLWPLCHDADVAAVFRSTDFRMYSAANARFTGAVAQEAAPGSVVLVQDYHFALAPRLLRQRLPSSPIAAFWHIPWPPARVFGTCPWARELLNGLLGAHLVGLQTPDDCDAFLECAAAILGAEVDLPRRSLTYRGQRTAVRPFPVGIDWAHAAAGIVPSVAACRESVRRDLRLPPDVRLAVGVDRLDYSKGIAQKILAVERLLDIRPDLQGRFALIQIAEPSRDRLPAYQAARAQIRDATRRVNARYGTTSYCPVHLIEAHHEPSEVYRFYRAADVCYVNSLRDGMNLVAKEFVAAREDERGVLVLSDRAGAARQLGSALLVDPRDANEAAATLSRALEMSEPEQARRMSLMRSTVRAFDASWWANQLISGVVREYAQTLHAASGATEFESVSA